jgi:hypothetical protein
MQPPDERDSDQLTIPALAQAPEHSRGLDSLGPSRSLPARASVRETNPLAVLASALGILAAFALFTLPSSRGGQNARTLLAQTLVRLTHGGLPLSNVQCPRELELTAGKPFSCSARANGASLRIELTPAASQPQGAVDTLHTRVDGAVGVAEVAQLAAARYGADARVTCRQRYWLESPGTAAGERCTLYLRDQSGPLSVGSRNERGELTLEATWVDARHASAE